MRFPFKFKISNKGKMTDLYLYGEIGWELKASEMQEQIAQLKGDVRLRVHCIGGDVMDGIAIYNILNNAENITVKEVYVDGMAASMGAVLMFIPGAKRIMVSYSRMMLHRASGYVHGDADQISQTAKLIQAFEDDLIKMISNETQIAIDIIKTKYFDGQDHWLTADEALEAGLIHEKVEGKLDKAAALLEKDEFIGFVNNKLLEKPKKDKMKISAKLGGYLALDANAEYNDLVVIENAAITAIEARDAKIVEIEAKLEAAMTAQKEAKMLELNALLNAESKKLTQEQKDNYLGMAEHDLDLTIKAVKLLPDVKNLREIPKGGDDGIIPEAYKDYKFSDYQKDNKAAKFLASLKETNPEEFQRLRDAEFGEKK